MKTILSLDGGGIRGIISALLLADIERRTKKPVAEIFDLIAGTSTGGILALGLSVRGRNGKPAYSARQMAQMYIDHADKIFPRSFWRGVSTVGGFTDEKYPHQPLEELLDRYFEDTLLRDCLTKVLISAYDIESRTPRFFKSWRADAASEVPCRHVARATSAAPTYFEPAPVEIDGLPYYLIDGGVFVNNPCVSAYAEAKREFANEEILLVSVGTGEHIRPICYDDAKDWGKAGWMLPVLSTVFDGVSDAANYQMEHILGDNFHRFQIDLKEASDDMDNVTGANLAALRKEARRLISGSRAHLDELCGRLGA